MKVPKIQKKYCPKCKTSTEHEVSQASRGAKRGSLKAGQRRRERLTGGHGDEGHYSKPAVTDFNRNSKTVKKLDLRYKCKKCGTILTQKSGVRVKKFEITK